MLLRNLPLVRERIQRCKTCGKELKRRPLEYAELPHCKECLAKAMTSKAMEGFVWTPVGKYVVLTRMTEKPN